MNSCVLITSHLNNSSKIEAAHNLVDFLQDKGLPIIFVGNSLIPESIQKKVDWVLFTKENPKVNRAIYGWIKLPDYLTEELGDELYKFSSSQDYGYAHLLQTYRGFKFAKSLDFDHVIHFNYDMIIDDQNWNVLTNQVKITPNIVNNWKGEYATNFYTFLVGDFIQIMDENLHYYKNINPPNIHRQDWFCEVFFKWAVDKSEIQIHKNTSIEVYGTLSSNIIYWEHGKLEFSYYEKKNIWLMKSFSDVEEIKFKVNNQVITAEKISDTSYFLLPHIEGDYYFNQKLVFNSKQLKTSQWLEKR